MKPVLWLLTTVAVAGPMAHAQSAFDPTPRTYASANHAAFFDQAPSRETVKQMTAAQPGQPRAMVEMPKDGKCQGVRAGDLVHFTLRIESAQDARAIYTDLQLANGNVKYRPNDLPLPGGNVMGGGGAAMRDRSDRNLYHFAFVVPDVMPGIYKTLGIAVRGDYGAATGEPLQPVGIPLNRHAAGEVHRYCLAVFGPGGSGHRPIVTEFKPGPVDRATALPPPMLPSNSVPMP